ncbi:DUF1905 domain-containing protein [Candidatus Kaiserbacteria bacterium]|nr:DUF1905 domain-containing protein [Candidatus Kaiserbacteria bacterium]
MSSKYAYTIHSKVFPYPGMTAWRFAHVDKIQSAQIREKYGKGARGFGSIPVSVLLGASRWDTSIFPDKQSGTYLLPLKSKIRQAEGVDDGDAVTFKLKIRMR